MCAGGVQGVRGPLIRWGEFDEPPTLGSDMQRLLPRNLCDNPLHAFLTNLEVNHTEHGVPMGDSDAVAGILEKGQRRDPQRSAEERAEACRGLLSTLVAVEADPRKLAKDSPRGSGTTCCA